MNRIALVIWLATVALGIWLPFAGSQESSPGTLRRIEIAPELLTPEMRRQYALVPLLRRDFENLVSRATRRDQEPVRGPQLVEAQYAARLETDSNSLVGTARWTVQQPSNRSALLRVQPWNLAWRERPRWEDKPAVCGEGSGESPVLVVGEPGKKTLEFAWSARADVRPDGLWFFLQLPPAPVAVLDLEVPADRVVECPGHRPILIPDSSDPQRSRWRLVFGSTRPPDLELLIRPSDFPKRPQLLWAAVTSTVSITPVACESRFVVDLRVLHRPLREVRLRLLGPLEVLEVARLPRLASPIIWSSEEGPEGRTVRIRFSEPMDRQSSLELRCRCDLPAAEPAPIRFTFPGVEVLDAWAEPEHLRVRLLHSLSLSRWDLGDFRLAETPAVERDGGDLFEVLRLVQNAASSLAPRRPQADIRLGPADLAVSQDAWWRPGQDASLLDVVTRWRVRNSPTFQIRFQLPEKAQIEQAEILGSNLEAAWRLEGSNRLVAEFREPIPPRGTVKTRLRLRLPPQHPQAVHAIPSVVPLEAKILECGLGISLPPAGSDRPAAGLPRLAESSAVVAPIPTGPDRPWSEAEGLPDVYFLQRGQVVSGRLEVRPAPPGSTPPSDAAPDPEANGSVFSADSASSDAEGPPLRSEQAEAKQYLPQISDAVLTTWVAPDGHRVHQYEAQIVTQDAIRLSAAFPDNVALESVRLGTTTVPTPRSGTLEIPVPGGENRVRLHYRSAPGAWGALGIQGVPLPRWQPPIRVGACRHRIVLRTDQVLVYPSASLAPAEAALPLGESLSRALQRLWTASDASESVPETESGSSAKQDPTPGWEIRTAQERWLHPSGPSEATYLTLWVVPAWSLHFLGALLGFSVLTLCWRRPASRWLTVAVALLLGLLLLIWLPSDAAFVAWWVVGSAAGAGLWFGTEAKPPGRASSLIAPSTAAALALLLLADLRGQSQTPGEVVFLLREADKPADEARVLVPQTLLRRLQAAASGEQPAPLPEVVLLSAEYTGAVQGDLAKIRASYEVEVLTHGPVDLPLPLSGVRLEHAALDGESVSISPQSPEGGFLMRIERPGGHKIELRFQVPVRTDRAVREVRFGVPPLTTSVMKVRLPPGSTEGHLIGIRGRQVLKTEADQPSVVEADLGRVPEVHLRWFGPTTAAGPMQGKEAFVVDISPEDLKIRAALRLDVPGQHRLFRVMLPRALQLQAVELRGDPEAVPPVRLRDWRVEETEPNRLLIAETARPVRGQVTLLLDLVIRPERALDSKVPSFPAPDRNASKGASMPLRLALPYLMDCQKRETVVAFRSTGLVLDAVQFSPGLAQASDLATLNRLWSPELGGTQGLLFPAYGQDAVGPELLLQIGLGKPALEVLPTYRVRPDAGAVEVALRLDGVVRRGGPALLTLELPPGWLLSDVQGPDLHRWMQTNNRLELWLKKLDGEKTYVELSAWIPQQLRDGSAVVVLEPIRIPEAVLSPGRVELAAADSQARLVLLRTEGVSPAADGRTYAIDRPHFSAHWQLLWEPLPSSPQGRPRPTNSETTSQGRPDARTARVLGAERRSLLDGAGRCEHWEGLIVHYAPEARLTLHLPPGAEVHAVRLNGKPFHAEYRGNRLSVHFPSEERVGFVEVVLTQPLTMKEARRVELRAVRVDGESAHPVVWEVTDRGRPTGDERPSNLGPATRVEYAVGKARLWLAALRLHQQVSSAQKLPSQSVLEESGALTRQARMALTQLREISRQVSDSTLAQQATALQTDLEKLLGESAARSKTSLDELQVQALQQLATAVAYAVFDRDGEVIRLDRADRHRETLLACLRATAVLLGLAAGLLLWYRLDPDLTSLARTWPEVFMALGVVVWWLVPSDMTPVLLLIAGLAGRALRWLAPRREAPPPSSARTALSSGVRPGSMP